MIENDIVQIVREHYQKPDTGILLLSALGALLTKQGLWPTPNDKRPLLEITESIPEISLVRDEEAASYIAIVLVGEEQRATDTICDRHKRYFLRGLPRALLLAFTLDVADGQVMSVRLGPPVRYQAGPPMGEGVIAVDSDLRLPGLDISDLSLVEAANIQRLEACIRTWCERNRIDPGSLVRMRSKSAPTHELPSPLVQPLHGNALERLYAAQQPDVAKLLIVPIDIALALSRMP